MLFKNKKFFSKSTYDYLVVGLGNPGDKYENTRHNCGFMMLDSLCEKYNCSIDKRKFRGFTGECNIGDNRILLLKPDTFMNNSGISVKQATDFYKIKPEQVIIVFDDISLSAGKLRIRRKGGDGGHNGIKSIVSELNSEDFPRIKIGVGSKPDGWDLADWVLSSFEKDEKQSMKESFAKAVSALECMVNESIDSAMNKYSK